MILKARIAGLLLFITFKRNIKVQKSTLMILKARIAGLLLIITTAFCERAACMYLFLII